VKIGISISESVELTSGVPQGGILSLIIFYNICSRNGRMGKTLMCFTYAYDTESSCKEKDELIVMKKVEEDASKHSRIHCKPVRLGCKPN